MSEYADKRASPKDKVVRAAETEEELTQLDHPLDPAYPALSTDMPPAALNPQSVLHLQRIHGNQRVQQMLGQRRPTGGLPLVRGVLQPQAMELDDTVPDYLLTAFAQTPDSSGALAGFRQEHRRDDLRAYQAHLGLSISQNAPLQSIRRMGRADRESREDLATAPITDEFVRDIFEFFYPGMSQPTSIGDPEKQLAAEMLWRAIQGSRMMDLVPRPPGGAPGISWLARQAVQMAWRRGKDEGIYVAVRNTVAAAYRRRYDMCVNGIGF